MRPFIGVRRRSARALGEPVRSYGFTLVELLVVIGIIALLIAILLPALSKARIQSKFTVCAERQRQIVMALHLYAQENRGFFPRHDFDSGGNLWDVKFEFYDLLKNRYNIPHKVFFCPDVDDRLPATLYATYLPVFYRIGYSYWVPRGNHGQPIPPEPKSTYWTVIDKDVIRGPIKEGDRYGVLNPILTDSVVSDPNSPSNADLSVQGWVLNTNEGWTPHRGRSLSGALIGMNEAWADGHVQRLYPSEIKARYKGNYWNWR